MNASRNTFTFNLRGTVVRRLGLRAGVGMPLDVSALTKGVYILKARGQTGEPVATRRFLAC